MLLANKDIRGPQKGVSTSKMLNDLFTERIKDKPDAHLREVKVARDIYNTVVEIMGINDEGRSKPGAAGRAEELQRGGVLVAAPRR